MCRLVIVPLYNDHKTYSMKCVSQQRHYLIYESSRPKDTASFLHTRGDIHRVSLNQLHGSIIDTRQNILSSCTTEQKALAFEIAGLLNELRAIEKKSDRWNCRADATPGKNERIETDDEASWRESATLEIRERDILQASISK